MIFHNRPPGVRLHFFVATVYMTDGVINARGQASGSSDHCLAWGNPSGGCAANFAALGENVVPHVVNGAIAATST